MNKLRERAANMQHTWDSDEGDQWVKDALDLLDEMATCIDQLKAAMWDAHYGKGISVPYVQSRDKEARVVLAKYEGKS